MMQGADTGFASGQTAPSAALSFTKFLFVVARRDDASFAARLRAAGQSIARGFFNDFDADGTREGQPHETIQFLVAETAMPADCGIAAAQWVVQVSGKYRPRLVELEAELRRRVARDAEVVALDGVMRAPRYTSAEMYDFAYRHAAPRRPGRVMPHAVVLPLSKTAEWWEKSALERHAYFYPHVDAATGCAALGHARSAEEGIPSLFRRLFHNPDGYGRPGEFDFVTYFECEDGALPTFERVHQALRDTARNPEWRYVQEGPLWRGRRVLRW